MLTKNLPITTVLIVAIFANVATSQIWGALFPGFGHLFGNTDVPVNPLSSLTGLSHSLFPSMLKPKAPVDSVIQKIPFLPRRVAPHRLVTPRAPIIDMLVTPRTPVDDESSGKTPKTIVIGPIETFETNGVDPSEGPSWTSHSVYSAVISHS